LLHALDQSLHHNELTRIANGSIFVPSNRLGLAKHLYAGFMLAFALENLNTATLYNWEILFIDCFTVPSHNANQAI